MTLALSAVGNQVQSLRMKVLLTKVMMHQASFVPANT
jgi:hypothetical protein